MGPDNLDDDSEPTPPPTLRETIEAATRGDLADPDDAPADDDTVAAAPGTAGDDTVAPAGDDTVAAAADTVSDGTDSVSGQPSRDGKGRFAKKPEGPADTVAAAPQDTVSPAADPAATAAAAPAAPDAAAADAAAPAPPGGWSIAAKAEFEKLPQSVKDAVANREAEINNGFAKLRDYKGMEPFVDEARNLGITVAEWFDKFRAAEQLLDRDPIGGVRWIMQQWGVRPDQLGLNQVPPAPQAPQTPSVAPAAPQTAQPGQIPPAPTGAPTTDPAFQALAQEVNGLKTSLSEEQARRQREAQQSIQAEIDAFFADPANKYAANVQTEIAGLLSSGLAKDLKDAYDQALFINPETRALVINDQTANQQATKEADANQRRNASASITGSSGTDGNSPNVPNGPAPTLRDEIVRAMDSDRV